MGSLAVNGSPYGMAQKREVGKHWPPASKEAPELGTAWGSSLDNKRAVAGDLEQVETFLSGL